MIDSLDILYLVIAFAVLWVTAFVCWFIWQVVVIMKELHKTIHSLTFAIENVERAINGVKSKFGSGNLSDHFKKAATSFKEKVEDINAKK